MTAIAKSAKHILQQKNVVARKNQPYGGRHAALKTQFENPTFIGLTQVSKVNQP